MNVVLSGIFYPMAILRYFERALRRRSDINLFTAGPWSGSFIPWNNGMHLPEKYSIQPDFPLPMDHQVPAGFVESRLPWVPDMWIQVDAGFHFQGKPSKGVNIVVGTDPHCLDYAGARNIADKFYCMQTPYMKPGDVFMPYAYDPVCHTPIEGVERVNDVAMIGMIYDTRARAISIMRQHGFRVIAETGPIFEEAQQLYATAKTGFNWSSLQDLTARVFEVMAMGLTPVVNNVPDLKTVGFIAGVDYLGFDALEDVMPAIHAALDSPIDARTAVKEHTWDARVTTLLNN